MSGKVLRDVMTTDLVMLESSRTAADAARSMRDRDVGDVLVTRNGALHGIVTDRDLVVRCLAEGQDPRQITLAELCKGNLVTLEEDSSVGDAVKLMIDKRIRRLPVVRGGRTVGIVTLGDLAVSQDSESALGRISAAPPNR